MPLVDVVVTVAPRGNEAEVKSPVTGARGLLVHLEVVEGETSLGSVVLGDAIELRAEGGARYVVIARRARFGFVSERRAIALDVAPTELVPLILRSRGGALAVYEHVVRAGDRLRLRAQVDAGLVRDDASPVWLDEVV